MGTLIVMRYPTSLALGAADHTYVVCGTGARAWSCWGGKTGGTELKRGPGSTRRADCIAKPDEKAGIKCYAINGVCHQSANRILLPAGLTVSGARGYGVSEALFSPYGRVSRWPCHSPFDQCGATTGELPECDSGPARRVQENLTASASDPVTETYLNAVLALLAEHPVPVIMRAGVTGVSESALVEVNVQLFAMMVAHRLRDDATNMDRLMSIRRETEFQRVALETDYMGDKLRYRDFVKLFDEITLAFQARVADVVSAEQYERLFDIKWGERIVVTDPAAEGGRPG